jgi:thymidylate synthase
MSQNQNIDEQAYLDLLRKLLETGSEKIGRNGKIFSSFGERLEFNIENKFPLLTTKRMFWKGIVGELVWFLNANTNAKELKEMGVGIWDGNSTREYLDSIGLTEYEEGDCGPIYGFQWRNFNGTYKGAGWDKGAEYVKKGDGFDQLGEVLRLIRTQPNSRRIFMSGWNPTQMPKMALPPCHVSYQFYVQDGKLSCQMYQRSGDMFLGVPFNIASTALLTYIIAHLTDLIPHKIILVIGDAHIYEEHIDAVKKQIARTPTEFCQLEISNKEAKTPEDFKPTDFLLFGYKSQGRIAAKMVV